MTTLSVLGVGKIGGEVAFLASLMECIDEIILYDAHAPLLHAQVLDLRHTGVDVGISTDTHAVKHSDICVFSAGLPRNPAVKTRADLLAANLPVASECSGLLHGFEGVLVTVTNPMDPNNYYLYRKAGLGAAQCIGFGGQLDSARFDLALKERSIQGGSVVIGEHGEHQVPLFSRLPGPVPEETREHILHHLRGSSMEVIRGKGGTVFGPAFHISELIRMIATDARSGITCSCILDGEHGFDRCSLGVPAIIGRSGVVQIQDWQMDPWEQRKWNEAGIFIRDLCKEISI
jgi:malate dehydrogenase